MRVLFLASPVEDYLSDTLLHGLRSVLGDAVVEVPRAARMYRTIGDEGRRALYGHGFTLYGLLDEPHVDRTGALEAAREGAFDVVIVGDIWRSHAAFAQLEGPLRRAGTSLVVLDGQDAPAPYPYHPHFWKTPRGWALRRAHTRVPYFKRELTPATGWYRSFLLLPPPLARLAVPRALRPIAFSIPEEKIVGAPPAKDQLLASHVVDREVAARRGSRWGDHRVYSFTEEADYYADLRRSRFGVTTKRAGWDALRHYETAANGCVPAFRDLDRKPPLCAPHGLDRTNCVVYRNADDLFAQIESMPDERYAELQTGALRWVRANTTRRRAERFLEEVGRG